MKEFEEWLQDECCYWYLLSYEQIEQYFSTWIDEYLTERKEQTDNEMV